jgi:CheY-like chemotaxis protein
LCDVLVVEDQSFVRMVVVDMLEDEGLNVREAGTPDEALRIGKDMPSCSLLVTDIDLESPDMDGFGVAEALRRRVPGMPAVFVSGRPWLLQKRALEAYERALAKPFTQAELVDAVRALMRSLPGHPE